jgi:competence protein ComEA
VLPLPRRRLDPEVVRERLRALAAGLSGPAAREVGLGGLGVDTGPPGSAEPDEGLLEEPIAARPTALRPVVLAVAATALAAWGVVHVTGGGTPAAIELVPGTPVPSVSGVLVPSGAASGATPGATGGSAADPSASSDVVVVQVIGEVRRPGLVALGRGSRVADAVRAAGGLTHGGSSGGLNLARLVVDGEQIVVSRDSVAAPVAGSTGAGSAATAVVVDLNSATASDLDALPGVGPVMAGRILDWRTAHGRFTSTDQLREVSGIGARTFERLKPHVRV